MSQSLFYHAFGVRKGYEYRSTKYADGGVEFHLSAKDELLKCPECGHGPCRRRGKRVRRIAAQPIGLKPVVLVTEVPACLCQKCGKTFEVAPPFAPGYCRYSFGMMRFVCTLSRWMTLGDVAAVCGLGWDTVKAIVKSDLAKRYRKIDLRGVRYLAVDESYVGSKGRFLTVVIDLESGRILWVAKGPGAEALEKFFKRLRRSRTKIEAVACDMAAGYWSAIRDQLPKAAVVFDRFHIIKLANEKLEDIRRGLQREAGILGHQYLKGSRYLILTGAENVPDDRQEELAKALKFNEPLSVAYYLKEDLRALWDQTSAAKMCLHLESWCKRAAESGIAQMGTLAKTLRRHAEGILNYFKHRISTGKLEGLNNKIKTLKRKAYGFRDHAFFILKLYSLHESKFSLSGT